jgi:AICAR transformylase/IMP cyclohydrolase PurH
MPIERAILSVSDKSGIVELAKALRAKGVEILSTGGTANHLGAAGIDVTPIASWSGAPEILGGRVKTLTPRVFGAILHDRRNRVHLADVERLSIPSIDLVRCCVLRRKIIAMFFRFPILRFTTNSSINSRAARFPTISAAAARSPFSR